MARARGCYESKKHVYTMMFELCGRLGVTGGQGERGWVTNQGNNCTPLSLKYVACVG